MLCRLIGSTIQCFPYIFFFPFFEFIRLVGSVRHTQTQSLITHTFVFPLMRRFILLNLNFGWYPLLYWIDWNMALPHKMHKNSASVFVRFSCFFFHLLSSRLFVVRNLFALALPVASQPLLFSMLCVVGLMSCVVVILHEFRNSFERSRWMTMQTFLIMRFSKHTCLALMKSSTRRNFPFSFSSLFLFFFFFSFSTTNIVRYNRWSYINNTSFSWLPEPNHWWWYNFARFRYTLAHNHNLLAR